LGEADKNLLGQANERAAKLDRATEDIVAAYNALRAAEVRRDQGIEPLEGERSGRRFREEYFQRQQALNRDIEEARAKLNDALARRNALR
jgi:peptidoglycan hydrolase CwlO-like protein